MNVLIQKVNTMETSKKDVDNKRTDKILKTDITKDQTCLKMLDYFLF